MTHALAACVLEGLLLLHEELSVDPEAPWSVDTPNQTQALVESWYSSGRSALLPMECTGALVSIRH